MKMKFISMLLIMALTLNITAVVYADSNYNVSVTNLNSPTLMNTSTYDSDGNFYAFGLGVSGVKSTDKGNTWISITSKLTPIFGTSQIKTSITDNSDRVFAFSNNGKGAVSSDGGETWISITAKLTPIFGTDSINTAVAKGNKVFAFGSNGKGAVSSDGGNNWTSLTGNLSPIIGTSHIAKALVKDNAIYLYGYNGLCVKSFDDGSTWLYPIPNNLVGMTGTATMNTGVIDSNGYTFIFGTGGKGYKSTDSTQLANGNSTWTDLTPSLAPIFGTSAIYDAKIDSQDRIYLFGASGKGAVSNDGGDSWTSLTSELQSAFGTISVNTAIIYNDDVYAFSASVGPVGKCAKISIEKVPTSIIQADLEVYELHTDSILALVYDQYNNLMSSGYTLTYSSSNPSIADVNASGVVSAKEYVEGNNITTITISTVENSALQKIVEVMVLDDSEYPVQGEEENNDATININGDIQPVLIGFSIPSNISFSVDPNGATPEERFIASNITIVSNTPAPLKFSIMQFQPKVDSPHIFTDVLPDAHASWDTLSTTESERDIAIAINVKDASEWQSVAITQAYAKEIQTNGTTVIGVIKPNGTVNLEFSAYHGLAFSGSIQSSYDFIFKIETND